MAVTTKFPTANAAYSGTGLTNPNNGHADDGSYATCAPAKNGALGHKYQTFGFDAQIPSGATISAVKIIYEYKVSTTSSIATARTKAIIGGIEEENHDDTTEPTTDAVKTIDITADRTWSRNDLLDGTFEVVLEGRRGNSNTAVTFSFDYVKVEVTYTVAYTITAAQGSFSETGQNAGTLATRIISALNAAFTESGQAATLSKGYPLTASQGSFSYTGQDAELTYGSGGESVFTKLCKRQVSFSLDGR